MDIETIPQGWAAVGAALLIAATAIWAALSRKWRRADEETERRKRLHESYIAALHDWQDAIESGDAAAAAQIAIELDRMRKQGWHVAPLVALALVGVAALGGCRTPEPAPVPVLLTEHVRIVQEGDTVPPLPAGETRWWLCTPTGLKRLLPSDSPINRMEDPAK